MDSVKKVLDLAVSKGFVNNTGSLEVSIKATPDNYYEGEEKSFLLEGVNFISLAEEKIYVNGKIAIEGELIISKIDDVDCNIDEVGHLIISGESKENYEINELGELIYKY